MQLRAYRLYFLLVKIKIKAGNEDQLKLYEYLIVTSKYYFTIVYIELNNQSKRTKNEIEILLTQKSKPLSFLKQKKEYNTYGILQFKIECYHGTSLECVYSILQNGFVFSRNNERLNNGKEYLKDQVQYLDSEFILVF